MTNPNLARDYLHRAEKRVMAVALLFSEDAFADVVPESQEIVELALRAVLRSFGIAIPFTHDVSDVLTENARRMPAGAADSVQRWCQISKHLRRDRGAGLLRQ